MRSCRNPFRVRLSHPSQILGQEAEQHIGPFPDETLRSMRRAQMRLRGKSLRNLGHLEDYATLMAHEPGADLDQLLAQRGRDQVLNVCRQGGRR
jgi:hypothetical protein